MSPLKTLCFLSPPLFMSADESPVPRRVCIKGTFGPNAMAVDIMPRFCSTLVFCLQKAHQQALRVCSTLMMPRLQNRPIVEEFRLGRGRPTDNSWPLHLPRKTRSPGAQRYLHVKRYVDKHACRLVFPSALGPALSFFWHCAPSWSTCFLWRSCCSMSTFGTS